MRPFFPFHNVKKLCIVFNVSKTVIKLLFIQNMTTHYLKTDPAAFDAVEDGSKTHEIRFNDRGFCVGDIAVLQRTEHTGEEMKAGKPLVFSGKEINRTITHVLTGYGLMPGWCVLSIPR